MSDGAPTTCHTQQISSSSYESSLLYRLTANIEESPPSDPYIILSKASEIIQAMICLPANKVLVETQMAPSNRGKSVKTPLPLKNNQKTVILRNLKRIRLGKNPQASARSICLVFNAEHTQAIHTLLADIAKTEHLRLADEVTASVAEVLRNTPPVSPVQTPLELPAEFLPTQTTTSLETSLEQIRTAAGGAQSRVLFNNACDPDRPDAQKTLTAEADEDLTTPHMTVYEEDDPWAVTPQNVLINDRPVEEDDPWAVTPQNASVNDQSTDNLPLAPSENEQPTVVHMENFDLSDTDESYNEYLLHPDSNGEIVDENWDEPEPLAKADSELNERLYPPDNAVTDLSRVLKINELIYRLEPITDEQRLRIAALLGEFSTKRLQSRLPWLRKQDWSGHSLLLFLQFRNFWDSDCDWRWWEYSFWHPGLECWYPTYSRNNLTWDAARELIQQRLRYAPNEVISEEWFEEWRSLALWARGFPSFASFAVLRARFGDAKEWREYIDSSNNHDDRSPARLTHPDFSESAPDFLKRMDNKHPFSKSQDFIVLTPEQKLLLAIVETALEDYRRLEEGATKRNSSSIQRQRRVQEFQEVKNWFFSDDMKNPMSFENICNIFDVDSSFVRKRYGLLHF